MIKKLPFSGRIFWRVLAVVVVLVVLTWFVVTRFTDYEMTSADVGGSTISTIIFAYLVHLWILPESHWPSNTDGDPPPHEDESKPSEDR